ncbi:hypothetical protein [Leptospira yasudae]|uniref:STAS domain-containing protein n=1 Tax=Leptospira yasudae TaxID=2202201 RepID=A0A6N4QZ31_9LEPT|nr:hypothetical protein [Leptospira yasudae]TGL81456.1 hypothetical protein EHQ72_05960 [Leptospira yasudae]TGL81701.1 hypothetical protein EHQ77_06400 [Leptospira yasudae]TGL88077.1 hypothetical protein EHQ83_03760 [Leptospira yasudae]
MSQTIAIDYGLKDLQVNTVCYKLLIIEFSGIVNHETLRGMPAQLSSIFHELDGTLVIDIRGVKNPDSEFVRAFTNILHGISERFARYFIMTSERKVYNWILNSSKLRDVDPIMNFEDLKKELELDSLIREFEL